ncbi:ENV2 protein, partial [Ptilonorhynchus violaceus]|nr:ENV2 protein [Ptilonorhynchus violaceus]
KDTLCNRTVTPRGADWMIPANNTKWICMKAGITPCIATKVLNETKDFCVQVVIIPRVIYHPKEYVLEHQNTAEHHLMKREPFTALTLAVLLTIAGTGAGTGAAALITQPGKLSTLRQSVDEDLRKIDESITALTNSVRSLSEVVLQNRRGLDLLFWQQGGLCVALKEECCTYVDETGIVFDTLGELRKQIERREKERESYRSWYENWFNQSPWLTTLLSTIAGPLILLIIGLTFGPCIFNKVIEIVKGRLEAAHLLLVKTRYDELENRDEEIGDNLEWSRQELKRFNEQQKLS